MNDVTFTLHDIEKEFSIINKLSEIVRLVDPIRKEVDINIKPQLAENHSSDSECFSFWKNGRSCPNCVSARALNENDTFVKIEYNGDKVYMITAVPVVSQGKKLVLELLKDITQNNIIADRGKDFIDLQRLIKKNNELMIKDELTGVYNRRYLFERMPYEMIKNDKAGGCLSIIFAEIANINIINDTYGHAAGDHINKAFAKILGSYCRKDKGWVARYGGEEYIVVLNNTDFEQACKVSNRIKKRIGNTTFADYNIAIKADFGVYTVNEETTSADELIYYARKNLNMEKSFEGIKNSELIFAEKHLLTMRERDVTRLLLEGLSNDNIAQRLFVGVSTVKKHISSIFNKTHVKSRSEFLAYYQNEATLYR
jgi:diguanylate cyclase (GGDEF)-like protein